MKITKYNHSCLLVEEKGKTILIDPGNYSAPIFPFSDLEQLDYLLVTHEHQDHFDRELVKKLVEKFPHVKIITTHSIQQILSQEKIFATTESDGIIAVTPIPHEKIWMGPPAENIMVTIMNKLAHPGDSHTFSTTADIIALPLSGPWASTTQAVELGERLHPKVILPIHDFQWKDDFRKAMYQRFVEYFGAKGIDFKPLETGEPIEI